jgi:hypothetical protein
MRANGMRLLRNVVLAMPLGLAAICGSASPSDAWVRCGGERGDCVMNGNGHNLLRYGAEQNFFILETEGVDRIGCDNGWFGDPAYGTGKFCEYMPAPADQAKWTACASEGQRCNLPDAAPRRVRYGAGNKWIYKIKSSGVDCNNGVFPDIASGQGKSCQYDSQPFALAQGAKFEDCGTEGTECRVGEASGTILLRYGRGNDWDYRLSGSLAPTVRCGNEVFGDPARGETKFCQYANLPITITELRGEWTRVGGCFNCPLELAVQVGISGTRETTNTKSWAHTVGVELSAGGKDGALGGKIGYSFTNTQSEGITDALTRHKTETKTASCPASKKVDMFQWNLEVDELCYVQGGRCSSRVSSFNILCAVDQPNDFRPVCAPTACKDALCKQCG